MSPRIRSLVLWFAFVALAGAARAADDYTLGPDSLPQEGVPRGAVKKAVWKSTKIYDGTERDYWVYVPRQYDGAQAAALMVFQDGGSYVNTNGQIRVTHVFDNLIHKKEMPVTIGLFINPGNYPPAQEGARPRSNRSFEYDTLSEQYAKFLLEEMLPEIEKDYKISKDPAQRAICGMSSGGICAFTVAWERPDSFGKVVSHIGSFTNIRGGDRYPGMIRKTEKKPIKIFLQDGSNDLDNLHGHWPLANQQMAAALKFMKYDYDFILGDGAHNAKHGGAIFPDTMRWLWRDDAAK
jgi:enterochelin esterase-like enzyme